MGSPLEKAAYLPGLVVSSFHELLKHPLLKNYRQEEPTRVLALGLIKLAIAQWDDANPYDQAYVEPGPISPAQVKSPADLPLWGCHGNLVRNK